MAHLLSQGSNHSSTTSDEEEIDLLPTRTVSPKRGCHSSSTEEILMKPTTPKRSTSTSSNRSKSPISVLQLEENHEEENLIMEEASSTNQERAVNFSFVTVHTHVLEYAPDFVEKKCPWMLGWTKLDTTTYESVEGHQQEKLRTLKKKNNKKKRSNSRRNFCCGGSGRPPKLQSICRRQPLQQQPQKEHNRIKRTSPKIRRNRLLSMGYTNDELDMLEVQREVNDIMNKNQMNYHARLHFQHDSIFSKKMNNNPSVSKKIQKYAFDYPPSLFQQLQPQQRKELQHNYSEKQQLLIAPYLMM